MSEIDAAIKAIVPGYTPTIRTIEVESEVFENRDGAGNVIATTREEPVSITIVVDLAYRGVKI